MIKVAIFLVLFTAANVSSDDVLIVHSMIVQSHLYTIRKLVHALAEIGHKVTIIRLMGMNPPMELRTSRIVEYTFYLNNSNGDIPFSTHEENGKFALNGEHLWNNGFSLFKLFLPFGVKLLQEYCNNLLGNEILMEKLNLKKYSVAIVDLTFNDCGLAVANKLDVPIIGYWGSYFAIGPMTYTSGFNLPSSLPHIYSHLTDKMSFQQRTMNTFVSIGLSLFMTAQMHFSHSIIKQYIPNSTHPKDMYKDLSGFLIDSHPGIDIPQTLPPSFVKIGGIHMDDPKPLPNNIMDFINDDRNPGIILFSLGSLFDDRHMSADIFQSYFNAFGRLDQKVIAKSKGLPLFVPDNVLILPFVPQLDILANNKTVLFITHGGIKGIMESIYYAVPMLGIPIFLDQKDNMVHLKDVGAATYMEKGCSEQVIYDNIQEILQNPSYKKSAITLSNQMKSHADPKKVAIDLIQLVIKTNGADHLKMASRNLNIIQYLCLDILAFLIILLFSFIVTIYYIIEFKILIKAIYYIYYMYYFISSKLILRKQKLV